MVQQIIDRAKWIYNYNGGARSKYDCVKQAINETDTAKLMKNIEMFDISLEDLLQDIIKRI